MEVSVVVPTLNSRERLRSCLDALAEVGPAETVVVNGPSADGTSGMCRKRTDVDVLVELDDRNIDVARNAGSDRARGDAIAFLDHGLRVEEGWLGAIRDGLTGADCVTGPAGERLRAGVVADSEESRTIGGQKVTYLNGGNCAFRRETLEAVDGFDEYLVIGGARDTAHRLASCEFDVSWEPSMRATRVAEEVSHLPTLVADGGADRDWRWRYRSLAYRLVKNYGLRPGVAFRVIRHAGADAWAALREVARGEARPSRWVADGREVIAGIVRGGVDGLRARYADRSCARNPNGWSSRADRAVSVTDRR